MAALWWKAVELEAAPAVWCVSILDGCPWVDAPCNEASVVVVGDAPVDRLRSVAEDLAAAVWAAPAAFYGSVPTAPLAEGLRAAAAWAAEGRPVILSDTGDNPTAGAPQDRADVVLALQDAEITKVVLGCSSTRPRSPRPGPCVQGPRSSWTWGGRSPPATARAPGCAGGSSPCARTRRPAPSACSRTAVCVW